jgi:hypothetical protein
MRLGQSCVEGEYECAGKAKLFARRGVEKRHKQD